MLNITKNNLTLLSLSSNLRKATIKTSTKEEDEVARIQREKMYIPDDDDDQKAHVDRRLAEALRKVNKANFEKEINSLKRISSSKGRSAAVFELKYCVLGGKICAPEANVFKGPKSG